MIKKHHRLSYIKSRVMQIVFQKQNPQAPWITKDAISLLNELIKSTDVGLDFGSGRSTKWFATRCQYLFSIENNLEWYNIVKNQIKDLTKVSHK